MKIFTVDSNLGMVTITSEEFEYCHIPNMYTKGRAGIGLQVEKDIDEARVKVMCNKISEAVLEYLKGEENAKINETT